MEGYNLPTVEQAFAAVRCCQWLSNGYRDIHLFRYDLKTQRITILAGETIVVVIPPSGVTTNPDIMVKPSLALMSRLSKVVLFQGLTIMSEFFLGDWGFENE